MKQPGGTARRAPYFFLLADMSNSTSPEENLQPAASFEPESQAGEELPPTVRAKSLRWGLVEGALSALYLSLCGGVFVIGLAVALGAGEMTVGILGAAPLFAMMATFVGTYLVEKGLSRRGVSRGAMFVGRILWLPFIATYPLISSGHAKWGLSALIILMLASSLAGAVGQVTWLGWMTEVVPLGIRGRYFGIRNAIVGLVATLSIWLGGKLVQWNFGLGPASGSTGYFALFTLGVVAGLAGVIALGWVAGGGPEISHLSRPPFGELVRLPMRDTNFRRYIVFQFVWMFGVYMSAMFFPVLMLRELKAGIGFVALVTALGQMANVLTFRGWGVLADRYGNKPIMIVCCLISGSFPLWWFFITPHNYWWPLVILHFTAGISWAGYSLASNNLLLRLSPMEHNSIYLSIFNSLTGLSTALGPLIGGLLGIFFGWMGLGRFCYPLLGVFLIAAVIRYSSIRILSRVREPEEAPVMEVLRELGTARGFNTLMSLDALLQIFLMPIIKRENKKENS